MSRQPQFPTPIQDITLNLIFAVMREERINRTDDEYKSIAARLPALKELTYQVNQLLQRIHECSGGRLPEICRFKAGDQRVNYEPYPKSISQETVRAVLEISGMRQPRWEISSAVSLSASGFLAP